MDKQNTIYASIDEALQQVLNPSSVENTKTKNGLGIPPLPRPSKDTFKIKKPESTSTDYFQIAKKNFDLQIEEATRKVLAEEEEEEEKQNQKEFAQEMLKMDFNNLDSRIFTVETLRDKQQAAVDRLRKNLNIKKELNLLKTQQVKDDLDITTEEEKQNQKEFAEELLQKEFDNLPPNQFNIPIFVDHMGVYEGLKGGDDVLNIATLPYGITVQSTIDYNMERDSEENKNLTDKEFAIKFYTAADKELQRQYSDVDFNLFTSSQRISILSTFSNTNFKKMDNYKNALRKGNVDEMAVQLLDTISVKEKGAKAKTTVNGLAIRRAAEYNLLKPENKIEFLEVKSKNGNYNLPVIYNYYDKNMKLIDQFAPKQRLANKNSIPIDGSPVVLYSVSERKRITK